MNPRLKSRNRKLIRNTIIAVVTMLVLFVGSGVAYVYISGKKPTKPAAAPPPDPSSQYQTLKPHQPSPSAPEQAVIQALVSPVQAGSNSSITVKTNGQSTCSINVTYNNVPSKDSGLVSKVSDDYGVVTWSWTVDKTAPAGKWPVKVTCVWHDKSAVVIGDLQVTK